MLLALVLRLAFSFNISAGSDYALSGGSDAAYHLRVIQELVSSGGLIGVDGLLNYPFGSTNVNPPLMDLVLAGVAALGTAFGVSASTASAGALAWSAVVFGTLACIPMYFLGKEIVGTRTAGCLSALFLALCPAVISQTVFSNGTEVSMHAFFFILMSYFAVKGVKLLSCDGRDSGLREALSANRQALKYAALSGLALLVIELSWNGFRGIVCAFAAIMVLQALLDRLRYKDVRPAAAFYSLILAVGTLPALPYYLLTADMFDLVMSGPLVIAAMSSVLCLAFAMAQRRRWTVTVPACAIAAAAFLAVLYFAAGPLFDAVVHGNSVFVDSTFSGFVSTSSLGLSRVAAYFGWATMWFAPAAALYMLYNAPKNAGSHKYIFVMLWVALMSYSAIRSEAAAAVYAPAFAAGFAMAMSWLFGRVNFKSYFSGILSADRKTAVRRLFKPVPFLAVLCVALLVAAPNAVYAVDGGISSNEGAEFNDRAEGAVGKDVVGAVGYYVRTADDWKVGDAVSELAGVEKTGGMVTWMDYASDAARLGGFPVVCDDQGNGAAAMANILLSDAVGGGSAAASLVYLLTYAGVDGCKKALKDAGMSEETFKIIEETMGDPGAHRDEVVRSPGVYGKLSTSVSDENVMYLYLAHLLTERHSAYEIEGFCDAVSAQCGRSVDYVMVTGGMYPMYVGGTSIFSTLAYLNGYKVSQDGYSQAEEFMAKDYGVSYYGIWGATESLTDSLLWRAYIGMSPEEAGFTGGLATVNMVMSLFLSDGKVKACPGYGLSNYEVLRWNVMYNPDGEAKVDSDGWEEMDAAEAIALQDEKGGLINYLSGLPVILKRVANGDEKAYGTVTYSDHTPAKGVRVSIIDADGNVRGTAFTGEDGSYALRICGEGAKLSFHIGTDRLSGGSEILTAAVPEDGRMDVTVPETSLEGEISGEKAAIKDVDIRLEGKTNGRSYQLRAADGRFTTASLAGEAFYPDEYTVTVVSNDGRTVYSTTTYLASVGENIGLKISLETATVNATAKNEFGVPLEGETVVVTDLSNRDADGNPVAFTGVTDSSGSAKISVTPGSYVYSVEREDAYVVPEAFTVEKDKTKSITLTVLAGAPVAADFFPGAHVRICGPAYSAAAEADASGHLDARAPAGSAGAQPLSVYCSRDGKVWWAVAGSAVAEEAAHKVSGAVKTESGSLREASVVFTDDATGRSVAVGSRGSGYSAELPDGTYTVYATDSDKLAAFEKLTVSGADVEGHDIVLKDARKVSGETRWASSSSKLQYVPVDVSFKLGEGDAQADYTVHAASGADGKYAVWIPKAAEAEAVCTLAEDGPYFFYTVAQEGSDALEYHCSLAKELKSGDTSATFTAYAKQLTVRNDSDYEVAISGVVSSDVKIPAHSEGTVGDDSPKSAPKDPEKPWEGYAPKAKLTSTYIYAEVEVEPGDSPDHMYRYAYDTVRHSPTDGPLVAVDPEVLAYRTLTVTMDAASEKATVSISPADDGDHQTKEATGLERVYYLQDGCEFKISVQSEDREKRALQMVRADADVEIKVSSGGDLAGPISLVLEDKVKFAGFVGMKASGELTVAFECNGSEFEETAKIESGEYSIELPKAAEYRFAAKVSKTVDGELRSYFAERAVPYADCKPGEENRVNLSAVDVEGEFEVVYHANDGTEASETRTASAVDEPMFAREGYVFEGWNDDKDGEGDGYEPGAQVGSDLDLYAQWGHSVQSADLEILRMDNAKIKSTEIEFRMSVVAGGNTFKLGHGASWKSVSFYSDEEMAHAVTTVVGTADVYGRGVVDFEKAAVGADGLSITLTDANGKEAFRALFDEADPGWVKSVPEEGGKTTKVGFGEDVISDWAYWYAVKLSNGDNFTKTFHVAAADPSAKGWFMAYEFDGSAVAWSAEGFDVDVKGHADKTVFLKLVSEDVARYGELPGKVAFTVTCGGLEIATDEESGVVIKDGKATVEREPLEASLSVSSLTAEGRGVVNSLGEMPSIVWVLVALVLVMAILAMYLGFRRGVFSRRK